MPVTRLLGQTVRGLLARRGFALARLDPGAPVSLDAYLAALPHRGIAVEHVRVFDANPEPVKVFLAAFPSDAVSFDSGPDLATRPLSPIETHDLLVAVDVDLLAAGSARLALAATGGAPNPGGCEHQRADSESWLASHLSQATVVIVRAQLGDLTRGSADVLELIGRLAPHGLLLRDALQTVSGAPLRSATTNVFLAFERDGGSELEHADLPHGRRYRIAEATSHLSAPVITAADFTPLAGRGSHGFAAGLCNPGAIEQDGTIWLLARGEALTWPLQKRNPVGFVSSCQPTLLRLGGDLRPETVAAVELTGAAARTRYEDFRLFAHNGQLYSNHSQIELGADQDGVVHPEHLSTSIGVSQVDPAGRTLARLGSPQLDRPVNRVEKNWAMFSAQGAVHLIYSFNPYRLYTSAEFPALNFVRRHDRELALPLREDGLPLRNSINPVPYDDAHLLHVVHKVYPGKQYIFWAILLDRRTLLPVRMILRPILRAGASAPAAIVYACSAVVRPAEVVIFAGLDDCSLGAWRVSRATLDRQWAPIGLISRASPTL